MRDLRKIVRDGLKAKGFNQTELAEKLGVSLKCVSNWIGKGKDRHIPAEQVPAICNILNSVALLEELAISAGCVVYPIQHIPENEKVVVDDVRAVQHLVREVGDALSELANTLADGKVKPEELELTRPKLRSVVRECVKLEHWLEKRCEADAQKADATLIIPGQKKTESLELPKLPPNSQVQ